jgi:hypothetical protein
MPVTPSSLKQIHRANGGSWNAGAGDTRPKGKKKLNHAGRGNQKYKEKNNATQMQRLQGYVARCSRWM